VAIFALVATLAAIRYIGSSATALLILLPFWAVIFRPWNRTELIMFCVASLFFLIQNFAVLQAGGFSFTHRDIMLMPYYEPFLWGFYYLDMKRFVSEGKGSPRLEWKGFAGLLLTALAFSLFAGNSRLLFDASLVSVVILLAMFHERLDIHYALYSLGLGFTVEIAGVFSGLWKYPEPDFLGIPYWFATMWISVGLLGRRFLIPLAEWIGSRFSQGTISSS